MLNTRSLTLCFALTFCLLSSATAADIASLQLLNSSGSATNDVAITFGHVFRKGDVPADAQLTARLGSGAALDTQINPKATHADGSLRHAIITTDVSALPSHGDTLILSTGGSASTAESISVSDVLASGFNADLTLNLNGTTYSSSARALLQTSSVKTWFTGPLASEFIVAGPVVDGTGTAHDHLTAYFHIRAYAELDRVRVDVVIENNWSFVAQPGNQQYDIDVLIGGTSAYQQNGLTHYSQARWHKRFWWGTQPQVYVKHDHNYLQSTKAIPRYEDVTPSDDFLNSVRQSTAPMDNGDQEDNMQDTGFQQGIGPLPRWDAVYAISTDQRAFNYMLANADGGGAYSVHYRDELTGYPISIDNYPRATLADPVASQPKFPIPSGSSPYSEGNWSTHQPSMGFLPYIITGDYYYLEEAQFWTSYNLVWPNYTGRNQSDGWWYRSSVRGIAWAYRSLAQVAYITPDDHPMKAYYSDKLSKNLQRDTALYVSPGGPHKNNLGAMYSSEGNEQYRFFDYFMSWVTQYMVDLGYTDAIPFRDYKLRFPIGLMGLEAGEFCFQLAPRYTWKVGPPGRDVFYSSFAEVYAAMYPDIGDIRCGSDAMRSEFDLSTVNEMLGNQFSTTYYFANLQPALAAAADSGLPGGKTAWDRSQLSGVHPDYKNQPIWAVIPHNTGPSITFNATPPTILAGDDVTLTWNSTDATSCLADGGWQGTKATTGSQTITSVLSNQQYSLTCSNANGTSTNSVSVTVNQAQTQLDDLPAGHWVEFENTRMDAVTPNPQPFGNTGPSSVMSGWSGGAYDSQRDQLLVWGGGHQDYSGNELYSFDVNRLSWSRLSEPSTNVTRDETDGRYPDGQPSSRHTYNALQYAPNVDRLFSLGFAAAYGPEARSGHSVDAFDFLTTQWQARASKPTGGIGYGDVTAYHPVSGILWHHSGASGRLSSYDPVNDQWTAYSSQTYLEYYATAAIDPTRNIMVAIGRNQFYVWDLSNPNASPTSPTASGPSLVSAQAPGFVYDPVSDRFVAWHGGANVYLLDPESWTWTQVTPAAANTVTPTAAEPRGTYGRFRYIPSKNAFIAVNRTRENVYAYKLTAGGGTDAQGPTISLSSSPSSINAGDSTRLTWSAPDADSCVASGAWSGSKPISSNQLIDNIQSTGSYTLSCTNAAGTRAKSVLVTVAAVNDTTPPSPPTALSLATQDGIHTLLTWNPSTDSGGAGLAGYRILRDGAPIALVTGATHYRDVVLATGREYQYEIVAIDGAGNQSASRTAAISLPAIGPALVRVNAGSDEDYVDRFNRTWQADFGFNTGNLGVTSTPISGTSDPALLQTQRWDPASAPELQYDFTVPNGDYRVNLYFADYYAGAHSIGARTFDVRVEGMTKLSGLDVFAEVGASSALVKTLTGSVRDGQLTIEFIHGNENTMISAIEVYQLFQQQPPVRPPVTDDQRKKILPSIYLLLSTD